MTERPILMSGAMVRAALREVDPKTQTRRVVVPQPDVRHWQYLQAMSPKNGRTRFRVVGEDYPDSEDDDIVCPYGKPGDRLWVRETFAGDDLCGWVYRADHPNADIKAGELDDGEQSLRAWVPSIHMPRVACRLVLEVTAVRVERLQAITWLDAFAEGFEPRPVSVDPTVHRDAARDWYMDLWNSLNAKRGFGWAANPWVWVVSFRRADALKAAA